MACDCIDSLNGLLEERNTRIAPLMGFPRDGGPIAVTVCIEVEKIGKRGKRPVVAVPTFCPFCGVRYLTEEATRG